MYLRQGIRSVAFLLGPGLRALAFVLAFSQGVSAAELTGFGPIKFGMSKEAALAALGGEIRQNVKDYINYEVPLKAEKNTLEVTQYFADGKAERASVLFESRGEAPELCLARSLRFSGMIQAKYGVAPATRHGAPRHLYPGFNVVAVRDIHRFAFKKGAYVQSLVQYFFRGKMCSVHFLYHPPVTDTLPF